MRSLPVGSLALALALTLGSSAVAGGGGAEGGCGNPVSVHCTHYHCDWAQCTAIACTLYTGPGAYHPPGLPLLQPECHHSPF